jgi:electron transfer flavoprotein-quinone oxidoreductase
MLVAPPSPARLSLIVREVLDLPAERIEERFALRPGEGLLTLFYGAVLGAGGNQGVYFTELYTNLDSLSLTAEVPLDQLQACGVPTYDVLAARERHPFIERLLQGTKLREYQAHLIPYGGVADLDSLYGNGVLLAGDAGRFTTKEGVGSWPAMASGVAAACAVKHACERGDFSRTTLAVYRTFLEEAGLAATQREARRAWASGQDPLEVLAHHPDRLFHAARRYHGDWMPGWERYAHSQWGEAYHSLVKPLAPWYVRWPLGLATWFDTRRWRKQQARQGGETAR